MENWKSISGAICLNVFMGLVEHDPEKIDDLILPLCCGLHLSDHWNQLNYLKTDTIEELRSYTSHDVITMKNMLIRIKKKSKKR